MMVYVRAAQDHVKDNVRLISRNLSPAWFLCLIFMAALAGFLVLKSFFPDVEIPPFITVVAFGSAYFCWKEWTPIKAKYGGSGFFDTLRRKESVREAAIAKKLAEARARDAAKIHTQSQGADIIKVALEAITHVKGEPRARKIAQRALKKNDITRERLGLILDNISTETQSGRIAKAALARV